MTEETGWLEEASPQSSVTRWRKKPVEVEMIRWDGSEEAWQLIANRTGGLPERLPDGSLNIWVDGTDGEANLDRGDWAVIDPGGNGVFPCKAADHAGIYEPAADVGTIPLTSQDLRRLTLLALPVTREDDLFVQKMTAAWEGAQ